jgi:hypothetical protein
MYENVSRKHAFRIAGSVTAIIYLSAFALPSGDFVACLDEFIMRDLLMLLVGICLILSKSAQGRPHFS